MKKKKQHLRGSVVVFSMLVLTMLLAIAVSGATVTIATKQSARGTEKSILAFQTADGAVEEMLFQIYQESRTHLYDIASHVLGAGLASCDAGVITGRFDTGSGRYAVTFLDTDDQKIACDDTAWRSKVIHIVAVGTFAGATRALDVGVRAVAMCDVLTVTDTRGTNVTYDTVAIGTQCWMKQNMRVGTMINTSVSQTNNGTIEKHCYSNDSNSCTQNHPNQPDGGLYSWGEAMQYVTTEGAQGICPANWHIPTDNDWYTLENYLKDAGQTCDATRNGGWDCLTAGVKLRPGGVSGFEGNFAGFYGGGSIARDTHTYFWSSTERGGQAWSRYLNSTQDGVSRFPAQQNTPISVRCIKN